MELQELYNKFIAEGCNRFFIEGVGGPQSDDVECLGLNNGLWEIYYIERGEKSTPIFSTPNKDEAIRYYHDHVMKIEHWHLVTFTRSFDILTSFKRVLEELGVRTIQNDIPHYSTTGDRVFRLFVTNKDIFIAQEKIEPVPYFDDDLKR